MSDNQDAGQAIDTRTPPPQSPVMPTPQSIASATSAISSDSNQPALSGTSTATASVVTSTPAVWRTVDQAKVDSFFDRARQGLHCSLFCGGVKCKHESWEVFKADKNARPAFIGLNSSWVTESVVASQRPSTSLFAKYGLIEQFKAARLTGVFNLQEKGEHSSCGPDGIYSSSGYSYNAEVDLMPYGIGYYEFPWPDMTAPDNDIVLRSVQVMASHVRSNGKVLVHCHAGLGRTGLMIACYLVYSQRMRSEEAIRIVRTNRPGAVQTAKQAAFVVGFERYINFLGMLFPIQMGIGDSSDKHKSSKSKGRNHRDVDGGKKKAMKGDLSYTEMTFGAFMTRQRAFLHGEEALPYRYLPRHIHLLMCRVLEMVRAGHCGGAAPSKRESVANAAVTAAEATVYSNPSSPRAAHTVGETFSHTESLDISVNMAAVEVARAELNKGTFSYDDPSHSIVTLCYLIVEWFRRLDEPLLTKAAIEAMAAFMREEEVSVSCEESSLPSASPIRTKHFNSITQTFMRHSRHTIACFLSFVETLSLLGRLDAGRRAFMIERVYDAISHHGRAGVPFVSEETRKGAVQYMSIWAEAVGTHYFFAPGTFESVLATSACANSKQLRPGADAQPQSPVQPYRSPFGYEALAKGRIINAVFEASEGARNVYGSIKSTESGSPRSPSVLSPLLPNKSVSASAANPELSGGRPESRIEEIDLPASPVNPLFAPSSELSPKDKASTKSGADASGGDIDETFPNIVP